MSSRDHRREEDVEVSFDGIVDFGSIPPPVSGQVDVHRAPTAVATMTDELMDEIRRARDEAKLVEANQTRIQPKFHPPEANAFTDEAPTRPGKEKEKTVPPAAEVLVTEAPLAPLPIPSIVERIERGSSQTLRMEERPKVPPPPLLPTIVGRPRLWPRVLFWLVTLAAIVVTALAIRRYRARLPH